MYLLYLYFFLHPNTVNKLYEMTKQTDLKGQHTFLLFYFVYMWQTLPLFELQRVFCTLFFL